MRWGTNSWARLCRGAGTGARKMIPFALPLLVARLSRQLKLVLVISPLNTPETDQVRCLFAVLTLWLADTFFWRPKDNKKKDISAIEVNSDSYKWYNNDMHSVRWDFWVFSMCCSYSDYMQRIESRAYNIITTSTELCLKDTHFSKLLWTPDFILWNVLSMKHIVYMKLNISVMQT